MRTLERILTIAITTLFIIMLLLVSLQVLNRYGPGYSIAWTEEMARMAYVLLIFLGSTLAVLQGKHIRVEFVVSRLPATPRRLAAAAGSLAAAIFFAFVAYGNYLYTVVNWDAAFPTVPYVTIGHVIAIVLVSSILSSALFIYQAFWPVARAENDAYLP